MATLTFFGTDSSSSLDTYSERSLHLEKPSGLDVKPSKWSQPTAPAPSKPSPLAKAAQCLRNVLAAVKNMGHTPRMCCRHTAPSNLRCISKPYPIPHFDEKLFQPTPRGTEPEKSSLFDGSISMRTAMDVFSEARPNPRGAWLSPSPDDVHTAEPSSNWAYKPCPLFDDESLQFLNAFLPSMEPLTIWSLPDAAETLCSKSAAESRSIGWIRRNTRIRPGHIIQVPSVHDKSAYLVSCEAEQKTWPDFGALATENHKSPKLFVAQCGDVQSDGLQGYPRAFIMCKPALN